MPVGTNIKLSDFPNRLEILVHSYLGKNLLDDFIEGREVVWGKKEKKLYKRLTENISTAQSVAEKLFNQVKDKNFKIFNIRLKADSIDNFTALYEVELNDFVSEEFRIAYTLAFDVQDTSATDTFYIWFSFIHNVELNERRLAEDGYFMKYEKGSGKTGSWVTQSKIV